MMTKSCTALLAALSLVAPTGFAAVTPQTVVYDVRAKLAMDFPKPLSLEQRDVHGSTVLQFNQPLEGINFNQAIQDLGAWISALQHGYDSLAITPKDGVFLDISHDNTQLIVVFRKDPSATSSAPLDFNQAKTNQVSSPRMQLLEGQLLYAEKRYSEAEEKLEPLARNNPQGIYEHLALSDAQLALGKRKQGLEARKVAMANAPQDKEIQKYGAELLRDYVSYIQLSPYRQSYGNVETINGLATNARILINDTYSFEISHKYMRVEEKSAITRLNGISSTFKGNRQQIELRLRDERATYGDGYVFVSHNGKTIGAGVHGRYQSDAGTTTGHAAINEAWLESSAAMVGYGHRDRLSIGHQMPISERVELAGTATINRYGLDGLDNAAESWEADASLRYQTDTPEMQLGYAINKEDAYSHAVRTDTTNNEFRPLDIADSEVHNLDLSWSGRLNPEWSLDSQLGYGKDMYGGDGPFASLNVAYEPEGDIEAGFNANYSNTSSRSSSGAYKQFGAYVKLRMP